MDQLLRDRAEEQQELEPPAAPKSKKSHKKKPAETQVPIPIKEEVHDRVIPLLKIPRKRAVEEKEKEAQPKLKKIKLSPKKPAPSTTFTLPSSSSASSSKPPQPKISVTLKLGPKPAEPESYPCCLCVSMSREGLLLVHDPPLNRKDAVDAANSPKVWLAHELCASIIPETWVDDFEIVGRPKQRMIFGVDAIVKDRWNLVCFYYYILSRALLMDVFFFAEMFGLHSSKTQSSWRPCSVHQGQMSKSFPCDLCAGCSSK